MKKAGLSILLFFILLGGLIGYSVVKKQIEIKKEEERIEKIKEGWYVEIDTEVINVRVENNAWNGLLGEAYEGEVYAASDVVLTGGAYWFEIDYNGVTGWVSSGKNYDYLTSYNAYFDFKFPELYYHEDIYEVESINDIEYSHITVEDDNDDWVITSKVYHEVGISDEGEDINQYWILYTVTDGADHSTSKMQKIVFEERPSESKVLDFDDYRR